MHKATTYIILAHQIKLLPSSSHISEQILYLTVKGFHDLHIYIYINFIICGCSVASYDTVDAKNCQKNY